MNTIQGEKELTTDDEPYKECRQCGTCFPMSKLSKHVMECVGGGQKRYQNHMHSMVFLVGFSKAMLSFV